MDGQIFNIEDAKIGLNVPPLHPRCRSTIVPYEEDNEITERIERDIETGKSQYIKTKGDMTFADWADMRYGVSLGNKIRNNSLDLIDVVKAQTNSQGILDKLTTGNIDMFETNQHKQLVDSFRDKDYLNIKEQEPNVDEEYINSQLEKVKELINDKGNEIIVRTKLDQLKEILEDGRIKNMLQVYQSNGNYNPNWRKTIERDLFNIPLDVEDSKRPIYAYLSNKDVEESRYAFKLKKYGDIKIVLNGKVKERSTFTFGDSMNNSAKIYPSKFKDIKEKSIRPNELVYNKWDSLSEGSDYPEVQVHKGVLLKDIYSIKFPKGIDIPKEIENKLKKNKIKIEYY